MTQWENVLVMRGLLCSGKVNYTASHPCLLPVQNRTVDKSQQEFAYTAGGGFESAYSILCKVCEVDHNSNTFLTHE